MCLSGFSLSSDLNFYGKLNFSLGVFLKPKDAGILRKYGVVVSVLVIKNRKKLPNHQK